MSTFGPQQKPLERVYRSWMEMISEDLLNLFEEAERTEATKTYTC